MSSRAISDARNYTQSLEKLSSNGSEAEILDVLQALKTIPISVELLRETGMGKVVAGLKKKFGPETDVHKESRDLVARWKKECEASSAQSNGSVSDAKPSSTTDVEESLSKSVKPLPPPEAEVEASNDTNSCLDHAHDQDHDDDVEEAYNRLPQIRQKIIDLLSEKLRLSEGVPASLARTCAFEIETNIDGLHSYKDDNKAYVAKARTLIANLKSNERIREDLVEGSLSAFLLVRLTPDELATDDVREAREREKKLGRDSRRSDYYETVGKEKIQRANGIDPSRGGEFTCSKCKGTRTSHYSLQTRSADEPMTVFVRCLNCGKRWRTQ